MSLVKLPNGHSIQVKYRWRFFDFFINPNFYVTLKNTTYISKKMDLNNLNIPLLLHEYCHIEQQKEIGIIKFLFSYFLFKSFRLQVEAKAYAVQIMSLTNTLEKENLLNNAAIWLSSKEYRYCAKSYQDAIDAIKSNMN